MCVSAQAIQGERPDRRLVSRARFGLGRFALVCAGLIAALGQGAQGKIIEGVPAYDWYHGCGPTAAASVIGYYDLHGFPLLFDASGWDNVKLTINVQDQISSPAHNARYDPTPDDPNHPVPPHTSIADWMRTSVDPAAYGASYGTSAVDAFVGYASYRGYQATCSFLNYAPYAVPFTWDLLVAEIDGNHPMLFLVDSDGDSRADHFVPVLGYEDRGSGGKYYGAYTTWSEDETVEWFRFRGLSYGQTWGISTGFFVRVTPEPAGIGLLTAGALSVMARRRRRCL